jgi:hypothetical protein
MSDVRQPPTESVHPDDERPDRGHPDDAAGRSDEPQDEPEQPDQQKPGLLDILTREGADAPDAADIEDPEHQL